MHGRNSPEASCNRFDEHGRHGGWRGGGERQPKFTYRYVLTQADGRRCISFPFVPSTFLLPCYLSISASASFRPSFHIRLIPLSIVV